MSVRSRVANVVYGLYQMRLNQQINHAKRKPRHVGIVLDGNRRWSKRAGFTDVSDGHRAGAAHVEDFLGWCEEANVEVVTLWMLSTDNLNRDPAEIGPLLDTIAGLVDQLAEPDRTWRLRFVGALDVLPADIADRLSNAVNRGQDKTGMQVNVAIGYGGRQEIADAVRKLLQQHAEAGTTIDELAEVLDVDHIAEHMYTSGQPDPDLLIRTSGEQRLSGFMLWQSVHSELWFCEAFWPEFRRTDFLRAMRDYAIRHRRFGS